MEVEKFLHRPSKDFTISQFFGEDKACIALDPATAPKFVYKETNAVCPVGYKSVYSQMQGHNGLDFIYARWLPIYALHDGVVQEKETEEARGLGVGLVTDNKYFCKETGKKEFFKTRYWHMIALNVDIGEHVTTGTLIGWADSTGYSTGDHLHLELKPIEVWKDAAGKIISIRNVLQNNGYFGSINPLPYISENYVLEIRDIVSMIKLVKEKLAILADAISDWLRYK